MWLLRDRWNLFSSAEQLLSWVCCTNRPMKGSMWDLPCPALKWKGGLWPVYNSYLLLCRFAQFTQYLQTAVQNTAYTKDWRQGKIQSPHKKEVVLGIRLLSVLLIIDTSSLVSWLMACLAAWLTNYFSSWKHAVSLAADWLKPTCLLQKQQTSHD